MKHPLLRLVPGTGLCAAVAAVAVGLEWIEESWAGRPYLEALVIAIILGTAVRTVWAPDARFDRGIEFSAKILLEFAVLLLGASVSFQTLAQVGPGLVIGIGVVVLAAIGVSYALSRMLGLPGRVAILVACGNSICGNSAIAAVAPVIGAESEDVASAIAFTAILGVAVVLLLPQLAPVLGLSRTQYGILAGLTVYAVPQVLAATVPVGAVSAQLGTVVKLVRVLMLGPVVILVSLGRRPTNAPALSLRRVVPWFIFGFLVLAAMRSAAMIPDAVLRAVVPASTLLTVVSMAALGLGVDLRVLGRLGGRVTIAGTLSLAALIAISLGLIRVLDIG